MPAPQHLLAAQLKRQWIDQHPGFTTKDYGAAMADIERRCSVSAPPKSATSTPKKRGLDC